MKIIQNINVGGVKYNILPVLRHSTDKDPDKYSGLAIDTILTELGVYEYGLYIPRHESSSYLLPIVSDASGPYVPISSDFMYVGDFDMLRIKRHPVTDYTLPIMLDNDGLYVSIDSDCLYSENARIHLKYGSYSGLEVGPDGLLCAIAYVDPVLILTEFGFYRLSIKKRDDGLFLYGFLDLP